MKKRRINVKKHTRKLKLGGTTTVRAHNRSIKKRKLKQMTAGGISSYQFYSDPYLETLVAKCEVGGKEACIELVKYAYENREAIGLLHGGYADLKRLEDFPLSELIRGIEVEFEHTNDPLIAIEIVMDHLTESFNYYIELQKMEKKLEKG